MGLFKSIRTLSRKAVACIVGTAMAASGAVAMSTVGVQEAKAAETVPQNLSFAIGLRNANMVHAGANANSSLFFTVKEGSTQYPYHQRAAYCVDANLHAPGWSDALLNDANWSPADSSGQAQYYNNPQYAPYVLKENVQGSLGWLAGVGFPNNLPDNPGGAIAGYPTSWVDSQTATQIAVWILKGQIQWNADKSALNFTPAFGGGLFASATYLSMAHNDDIANIFGKPGWKMSDVIDTLVADARKHDNQTEYTAHIYQPVDASKRGEWQNFMYVTREQPKRQVTIKKTSAKPEYTANNNAYSMEGAQYTLTNSKGQVVHTFTTKADGTATDTVEVPAGTYTIKETKAPQKGFSLNGKTQTVEVTQGNGTQTFTLNGDMAEQPISDPGRVKVQKALSDLDHAGELEGGVKSLAGIRFRVEWFKNVYTDANQLNGVTPGASAVWTTDDKGLLMFRLPASEGTWPFKDSQGHNVFPLGTVRITELSTPDWAVSSQPGGRGSVYTIYDNGNHQATHTTLQPWKNNANADNDPNVVAFPNEVSKGAVEVVKADNDTTESTPQGDASLNGTSYQIINKNDQKVRVAGTDYAPNAVITTITAESRDGKSVASTPDGYLPYGTYQIVEKDAGTGYHKAGFDKTFSITKNNTKVKFTLDANGANADMTVVPGYGANKNDVQRGGVQLIKTDKETGLDTPLGDTNLSGASFQIINRSRNAVVVQGKSYAPGEVVQTITTKADTAILDKNGQDTGKKGYVARTEINALPYGTYEAKEVLAPTGYLLTSASKAWSATFTIGHTGGTASTDQYEVNAGANQYATLTDMGQDAVNPALPGNQVQRQDFSFIKKDDNTGKRMGKIAWVMTSKTTGEKHVIVNDENGTFNSASCDFNDGNANVCVPHAKDTNQNDPDSPNSNGAIRVNADGEYEVADASKLNPEAGIWFTGIGPNSKGHTVKWVDANNYNVTKDGTTHTVSVNNQLRAFPYDEYTLTELATPGANDGKKMVEVDIKLKSFSKLPNGEIDNDGKGINFDYGTIDNHDFGMGTRLAYYGKGADAFDELGNIGDKIAPSIGKVTLSDVVDYWGVTPGKYTAKGELYVVDNGQVSGNPVATAEQSVIIKKESGDYKLPFVIEDASKLAGKRVVAYEYLLDENGKEVLKHTDATDEDQQLVFPEIHTNAMGDIDDESNANPSTGIVRITDKVTYNMVVPGKEYTMNAALHLKDKDGNDAGIVKDKNGKDVTSTVTFVPTTENGTVDVVFEFETDGKLEGETVVAFEDMQKNGVTYATHADISDENQDIKFPKIGTQAQDEFDGDKQMPVVDGKVKDTVAYENLTPGREYTMTATAHVQGILDEDGKEIITDEGPVLKDGKELTATVTFTPKTPNGTVDVLFPIDIDGLEGKNVVMFESLSRGDVVLAEHKDITDKGQTVYVAKIGTNLTDANNKGAHEVQVKLDGTKTLFDAKTGETSTADQLVGEDGKPLPKAQKPGKTETEHGYIEIGEVTERGGRFYQTVSTCTNVNKPAETEAEGNDQPMCASREFEVQNPNLSSVQINDKDDSLVDIELVDAVGYENLLPETKYALEGKLHKRAADGTDAGVLTDNDGKEVTGKTEFTTPKAEGKTVSGTENVTFKFTMPRNQLADGVFVAFEELKSNPGTDKEQTVAEHKDINDEGQTVRIVDIATKATDTVTGSQVGNYSTKLDQTDKVAYRGLNPGKQYVMKATLMNQNTGKPMTDKDGKDITGETVFTPTEPNGIVEVRFQAELKQPLEGVTTVAFEDLYSEGIKVATHADIKDKDQSVHYPKIGTKLTDASGKKKVTAEGTITLVDTVKYENLVPGTEYKLDGKLVDVKGNTIATGSSTFKPAAANGEAKIEFKFNADKVKGLDKVVAFEYLYDMNGNKIAQHEDLNDKGQTVELTSPIVVKKKLAMTGAGIGLLGVLSLLMLGAGAALAARRRI